MTYVMVPKNHPLYEFPYNLEDRVKDRINTINKMVGRNIDITVKKNKEIDVTYTLEFINDSFLKTHEKHLIELGFTLNKNIWSIELK